MQSTRPTHHANASRSLFQNPWTLTDLTPSTSTYLPPFPNILNLSRVSTFIPLERVRNSISHPHPPVKVVKPDWGNSTLNAASSNPNLKATWLGHAVRHSSPLLAPHHYNTFFLYFPELPRRVSAYCSWSSRRAASRLIRPHLLRMRRSFFMAGRSTSPASSLHSRRTTGISIRGLLPQSVRRLFRKCLSLLRIYI